MKLSQWMDVPGYEWCSMRVIEGSDPRNIANRYAFIEKTPRVRVEAFDPDSASYDNSNWLEGPKGDDDYGHNLKSREWCDKQLLAMGYELG